MAKMLTRSVSVIRMNLNLQIMKSEQVLKTHQRYFKYICKRLEREINLNLQERHFYAKCKCENDSKAYIVM